jgi:hypothetical protein
VPDGLFTSNFIPVIPCTRDLEDYARLWIPGLSSLLASLPTNYTVQLVTDGVQLRMFQAVESDGGTNYLFNETTASNQVADSASLYLGVLANGFPIILNGKTNVGEHFIFCGISPGTATVSLQVLDQGQNLTAIAPGSIQILDVKDMYERWTVGERPSYGPSNVAQHAVENMPDGESIPFQYPTNVVVGTPYILFVHGWNMETWQKDRYAETAFKRLYWQGYQGRFGTFRWPTDYDFGPIGGDSDNTPVNDPENYDRSEANAWASGAGLLNLLTGLNRQYSGKVYLMAHSMGNVVAGEALRLAGSTQLVNTYVALQGAVPAHAYDPSATTRTIPFPLDSGTPNRYAHYWTDTSPSYFNGSIGAGSYVNFYNPKDYALNMWAIDQNVKPLPPYSWSLGTGGTESYYRATSLFSAQQLFFQGDTYPIFSHIIQARCYALGAQSNMVGFAQQNLINLWPPDTHPGGNYGAHVWHSAEFRSDNMLQQKVWHALLGQQGFELKY